MAGENFTFEYLFAHSGMNDAGLATALVITQAAGDLSVWSAFHPMQVQRVGVLITTVIAYGTTPVPAVIAFDRRVTRGSDTGRVEMARITIPESTALGTVIYVDIPVGNNKDNGEINAGLQVVSEVITAGSGGTQTGGYQPFICWVPMALQPANNKDGAGVVTMVNDTTTVQV